MYPVEEYTKAFVKALASENLSPGIAHTILWCYTVNIYHMVQCTISSCSGVRLKRFNSCNETHFTLALDFKHLSHGIVYYKLPFWC